jgi:superfamily II DNA/RNA helicase
VIDPIALQRALRAWPEPPDEGIAADAPRLASALVQASRGECGPGDLAGLLRDAVREWQQQTSNSELPFPLDVPAPGPPWPDQSLWRNCGIRTAPGPGTGRLRILEVSAWRPVWLPEDAEPADAFAAGREPRRVKDAVPGDPVWVRATGFAEYKSLEQREAVRTLMTAEKDATVLIVLPTGGGKSLVGQLQPLLSGPTSISVVVVPTTSLAIDQEEQLRARLRAKAAPDAREAFAFHSGLKPATRRQILSRVYRGDQRVVFTSPESLFGALGDALVSAAVAGRLEQFVVDEAHIVASWGAEFRPDFQALAGLQRHLAYVAAESGHYFRTVLMTATATRADVATLAGLFSGNTRRMVVGGAASLRPELTYVVAESPDHDDRLARVREAVLHLPRPTFLYATTKADVAALEAVIRGLGIRRLVKVTGDSDDHERREAVRALRGSDSALPRADVALGTSAFGLGIDIEDVRSVVHACLPESIDRYYQEVGRAGRDGRAAMGLMLWTRTDEEVADHVSADRLIDVPLGRQRWDAMRRESQFVDGIMWVPLNALRIGLPEHSEQNERWNSRTLSAMARSGFIRLVGAKRSDGRDLLGVETLRDDLAAAATWDEFKTIRQQSMTLTHRRLEAVKRIATTGEVCDVLREIYTVHAPSEITADLVAHQVCGGCAACAPPRPVPTPPLPIAHPPGDPDAAPCLRGLADPSGVVIAVSDGAGNWRRDFRRLLSVAHEAGVKQLICPEEIARGRDLETALDGFVSREGTSAPLLTLLPIRMWDGLEYLPDVPALLLLDPREIRSDAYSLLDQLPDPSIAVVPAGQPSASREEMTIGEYLPGIPDVRELIHRLVTCLT